MALALPSTVFWFLLLLLGRHGETMRSTSTRSVQQVRDALGLGAPKVVAHEDPIPSNHSLEKEYNHINISVTYHSIWEEIFTFPERKPRTFNVVVATLKTWTADAVVQYAEGKRSTSWNFDWRRSAAFAVFGFFYVGLLQWVLYVTLLTWLFPDALIFANEPLAFKLRDRVGQAQLFGQVLVDNLVFGALIYFPIFYTVKELIQGEGSMLSRIHIGMSKYYKNFVPDNIASCSIWVPGGFVVFASPIWCRMPLEHVGSFAFTMIISTMRGAPEKKNAPKGECPRLSNDALCYS